MKYIKLFARMAKVFIKTSFQQEVAFRFDFFIKLLNSSLVVIGSVGGALNIFSKVNVVNGWSFYETLAVTAIFMFIQSFKNLFLAPSFSSISGLGGELWTGSFDFTLLKPIPLQMYVSMKNWSPLTLIDLAVSLVILGIAVGNISSAITGMSIAMFVISLFISITILYSIMLILTAGAFWYLGTPLLWIFDSLMEMGRYPVKIYPYAFKNILTWVIPIGIIVTFPAEVLLGQLSILEGIGSAIFAIVIFIMATLFFKKSISKYSSASS